MEKIGADKLAKLIDSLSFNCRECIIGLGNSNLTNSDYPYLKVSKNKLPISKKGIVQSDSKPVLYNITLDKWMIFELDNFFSTWKESNYDVSEFDRLIYEDNIYSGNSKTIIAYDDIDADSKLNKIFNKDTNDVSVSTESSILKREAVNSIYQPLTKSLVIFSKILFGTSRNLSFYSTSDDDINSDTEKYSLISGLTIEDFQNTISSEYDIERIHPEYSAFFNNDHIAYWLLQIRNSQNPQYVSNTRIMPFENKTPIFANSISNNYDSGEELFLYASPWNSYELFGVYGDGIQRNLSGKYWNFNSERTSFGINTYAEGSNSFSANNKTYSVSDSSVAFNRSTYSTDNCSSSFGIDTQSGPSQYDAFVKTDPVLQCTSSCTLQETESSLQIDGINNNYSINDTAVVFDAYTSDEKVSRSIEVKIKNIIQRSYISQITSSGNVISFVTLLYVENINSKDDIFSLKSGKIVKKTDLENNSGKFSIGQYNYINNDDNSIFQIGNGLSNSRDTFFKVSSGNILKIGSGENKNLYISPSKIESYINPTKEKNLHIDVSTLGISHQDGGKINMSAGILSITDESSNSQISVSEDSFKLSYADSYYDLSDSLVNIYSSADIEIRSSGKIDMKASSLSISSGRGNNGNGTIIIAGPFNCDLNIYSSSITEIRASTLEQTSKTVDIESNAAKLTGESSKKIINSTGTLTFDVEQITFSDSNSYNYSTFSRDPNSGTNFYIDSNTTAGIDSRNSGILKIKSSGLYMYQALNSNDEMVPDTTTENPWNYVISSSVSSDNRWILAKDFYGNDKRIWSKKRTSSGWGNWRSLSYHDESREFGASYQLQDAFVNVGAADGNPSKFAIDPYDSRIVNHLYFWTDDYNTVVNRNTEVAPVIVRENSVEQGEAGGLLIKGGPVSEGGIAEIFSFEVSKIGNTVTFDLYILVNDTNDEIAVKIPEFNAGVVNASDGYNLMAYIDGDANPALTPLIGLDEFHENSLDSSQIMHKLTITPYLKSRGNGIVQHSGCVFQIHRYDRKPFRLAQQNRALLRFSGHYVSANTLPLS